MAQYHGYGYTSPMNSYPSYYPQPPPSSSSSSFQQHVWDLTPPQYLFPPQPSSSTSPNTMNQQHQQQQPPHILALQNRDIPQRNAALASPVQHKKELLELLAKIGIMPEQALYLTRVKCERLLYERGLLPLSPSMYYVQLPNNTHPQPQQQQYPQQQQQQQQQTTSQNSLYPYPMTHNPQMMIPSYPSSLSMSMMTPSTFPTSPSIYSYQLQQEIEGLKNSSIDPPGDLLVLQMKFTHQQFMQTHAKIGEIVQTLQETQTQGFVAQQQALKCDLKDQWNVLALHSSSFCTLLSQYIQFVNQSKESCVNLSQLGQYTRYFFNQVQQHRIRCGMELFKYLQQINQLQDETTFRLSPSITMGMMTMTK